MARKPASPDPLRADLLEKLKGRGAHVSLEDALAGLPFELAGKRPRRIPHSAWSLLWHLRICQSDIVRWALEEGHESPSYPSGLWPSSPVPPSEEAWKAELRAFRRDRREVEDILLDPGRDLHAPLRPGIEESLCMMVLLIVDHKNTPCIH